MTTTTKKTLSSTIPPLLDGHGGGDSKFTITPALVDTFMTLSSYPHRNILSKGHFKNHIMKNKDHLCTVMPSTVVMDFTQRLDKMCSCSGCYNYYNRTKFIDMRCVVDEKMKEIPEIRIFLCDTCSTRLSLREITERLNLTEMMGICLYDFRDNLKMKVYPRISHGVLVLKDHEEKICSSIFIIFEMNEEHIFNIDISKSRVRCKGLRKEGWFDFYTSSDNFLVTGNFMDFILAQLLDYLYTPDPLRRGEHIFMKKLGELCNYFYTYRE